MSSSPPRDAHYSNLSVTSNILCRNLTSNSISSNNITSDIITCNSLTVTDIIADNIDYKTHSTYIEQVDAVFDTDGNAEVVTTGQYINITAKDIPADKNMLFLTISNPYYLINDLVFTSGVSLKTPPFYITVTQLDNYVFGLILISFVDNFPSGDNAFKVNVSVVRSLIPSIPILISNISGSAIQLSDSLILVDKRNQDHEHYDLLRQLPALARQCATPLKSLLQMEACLCKSSFAVNRWVLLNVENSVVTGFMVGTWDDDAGISINAAFNTPSASLRGTQAFETFVNHLKSSNIQNIKLNNTAGEVVSKIMSRYSNATLKGNMTISLS